MSPQGSGDNDDNHYDDHSSAGEWKTFDPNTCQGVYGLGISAVAPRPVAVITSRSENGTLNCAPFSYTGLVSHDPPLVCHGICMSREGKKDTLINIEETKQWVYNVLSDTWVTEANACSEEVSSDINELEIAGLDTLPCDKVDVPRVKRALVSMECVLESKKEVFNDAGRHTTTIVFGRIVNYHIHSSVLGGTEERPVVDLEKIRLCGRVGGITYWPAGEGKVLTMKRK